MRGSNGHEGEFLRRRQAVAFGITDRELQGFRRRGEMTRVRRGCYAPPGHMDPSTAHRRDLRALAVELAPTTVVGDFSAAVMHGLWVRATLLRRLHVLRPSSCGPARGRLSARQATVPSEQLVVIDGVRVTNLERTVADVLERASLTDALPVLDSALRRGLDRERLPAAGRAHRRRGLALGLGDARSESFGESVSRAVLHASGLPMPDQLQAVILDDRGDFVARVDLLWSGHGVVGEFDGEVKYSGAFGQSPRRVIHQERRRQQRLEELGYLVVRWGGDELSNPERFEARIRTTLLRAQALPRPRGSWRAT